MSRRRKKLPVDPVVADIESLSHEGRGITHIDGKTVFVDCALPGEKLEFKYTRLHRKYDEGVAKEIINPSPVRTNPECTYFGYCGGCSLQHMRGDAQLQHKQDVLLEQLEYIGKVKPKNILPPVTGPTSGYRHKARLGVKFVIKKGKVLVGFREKRSSFIADIDNCTVLHPSVANIIVHLKDLIAGISIYNQIPQIEVAVGNETTALVFRHLHAFTEQDLEKFRRFEKHHSIKIFMQPGGMDTVHGLNETALSKLSYLLPEQGLEIYFNPLDFTQINYYINMEMIKQALNFLCLKETDAVLDLFCGIGNFTLPLARYARTVTGVEGSEILIEQARENAARNKINNATFYMADLGQAEQGHAFMNQIYNKLLLDPPRTGALEIIQQMKMSSIEKLVYVSCNPATLSRDAGMLVNEKGFVLKNVGIMDMFPHTSHVESIALFEAN